MTIPRASAEKSLSDGSPKSLLHQSVYPVARRPLLAHPHEAIGLTDALLTMLQLLLDETLEAEFAALLERRPARADHCPRGEAGTRRRTGPSTSVHCERLRPLPEARAGAHEHAHRVLRDGRLALHVARGGGDVLWRDGQHRHGQPREEAARREVLLDKTSVKDALGTHW